MTSMHKDIERVLFSREEIAARVNEMGARITADYAGKELCAVAILRGAVVFFADMIRAIDLPMVIDFMAVSSYGNGAQTSGVVRINKDLDVNIADRHVLVIEDILDTGLTLSYLRDNLLARHPASLKICTLLDKPSRRLADISPDYVGFTIPDAFVVGCGLDFAERYRNLPYVGILKPSLYSDAVQAP